MRSTKFLSVIVFIGVNACANLLDSKGMKKETADIIIQAKSDANIVIQENLKEVIITLSENIQKIEGNNWSDSEEFAEISLGLEGVLKNLNIEKYKKTLENFIEEHKLIENKDIPLIENLGSKEIKQEIQSPQQILPQNNQIKKLIDLDIYHNNDTKELTAEGSLILRKAIEDSEELLRRIYNLNSNKLRCLPCGETCSERIYYYPKNEKEIIICANCAIQKSKFSISGKKYSTKDCKFTITDLKNKGFDIVENNLIEKEKIEEIKEESKIEENENKAELFDLVRSSALCEVLESVSDSFMYICNFNRRPISDRLNTPISIGEWTEQNLNPTWLSPFLLSNAYVASLYKKNNLFKDPSKLEIPKKEQKPNVVALLCVESDHRLIDLSRTFTALIHDFASKQQKNIMELLAKNPKLMDFCTRFIVWKMNLAIKNNVETTLANQIINETAIELSFIYNRLMTEPIASFDLKNEITNHSNFLNQNVNNRHSPQYQQVQQSLQILIASEKIENIIPIIKKLDIKTEEYDEEIIEEIKEEKEEIKENIQLMEKEILVNKNTNNALINRVKINLDEYYDQDEDKLTRKGEKFMKSLVHFTEKTTASIYDSAGKLKCSSCKELHENRMLLFPELIPEIRICIFCLENGGDFNYKEDSYTIKNKKLYLGRVEKEEKFFKRGMNEDEYEYEENSNKYNHLNYALKELELKRGSNLSYVGENMCTILKRILTENRRPLTERDGSLFASEFIEISLNEGLLQYYLLYLSYASSLYFEHNLLNDLMEFHSPIQPSETFINTIGHGALYVPTYVILYANKYISDHKLSPEIVSKYSLILNSNFTRYIAQMAITKEKEDLENSIGIFSIGGWITAEKIQKDINYICDISFPEDLESTRIEKKEEGKGEEEYIPVEEIEEINEFKKESMINIFKLDLRKADYKVLLEKRNFIPMFGPEGEIENEEKYGICKKMLFAGAALTLPLCWVLNYGLPFFFGEL